MVLLSSNTDGSLESLHIIVQAPSDLCGGCASGAIVLELGAGLCPAGQILLLYLSYSHPFILQGISGIIWHGSRAFSWQISLQFRLQRRLLFCSRLWDG